MADEQGAEGDEVVEAGVQARGGTPGGELPRGTEEHALGDRRDEVQQVEVPQPTQTDPQRNRLHRVVVFVVEVQEVAQRQHLQHPHQRVHSPRQVGLAELQTTHQTGYHQHRPSDRKGHWESRGSSNAVDDRGIQLDAVSAIGRVI